jgi:nucleotide-binding universal stress UspA family protein
MTPSRIAVGVDFSPGSVLATEHALAVARRIGADLALIHVGLIPIEPPASLPESMRSTAERWLGLIGERLADDRQRLAELRERLSGQGVEISHVVVDGYADTAIAATAHELGAALIVVGSHGHTGVRRFLLGSVAEKTVRLAERSVLVARGEPPRGGYRRVVVGTDFSAHARRAVEQAIAIAAPDAEIRIVHAWQMPPLAVELPLTAVTDLRAAAEAAAAQYRGEILRLERPADQQLRVEVLDGPPATVLDELSDAADLVVVGSHGRRGVRRWLLGSVAEVTVRHARCSVLVAR